MKTNLGWDPTVLALLGMIFFSGCGASQDPSFVENRRSVKVDLTVNEGDATAVEGSGESTSPQQSAEHLDSLGEDDVGKIFESLGTAETGSAGVNDSDATGQSASKEDLVNGEGGASTDSATSNSDTTSSNTVTKNGGKKHNEDAGSSAGDEVVGDNPSGQASTNGGTTSTGETSTASGSGGSGTGESVSGNDDGVTNPSPAEIKACAKFNGVSAGAVKVVGNKGSASISNNSVVAIKVAGNQSNLDLSLKGTGSVAAICIFVTGNRGTANVTLGVGLGNFIYVGRGNNSKGDVKVIEEGSIANIAADLGGNGATLSVNSQGRATCGTAKIHGTKSVFNCN